MRELNGNEMSAVAGGDRGDYQAVGSAVGGVLGAVVGQAATPVGAAITTATFSLIGRETGDLIADFAGEE